MSSTAVRVCALLVVLMVQNSWAGKPGFCPRYPVALPSAWGYDFPVQFLQFQIRRTGCKGDRECEGDLKCCPIAVCCHFTCTKPMDRSLTR
ncbi:uncharacterized protein [Penaeus vannamei]|uniref:uncharacterized protein isoform X3 n=1 Tax=Penaeus vannamei TaxID=6689 RepID=UPI00387F91C4